MIGTFSILRSTLVGFCILLSFAAAIPFEVCNKAKCKGPVKFYEDLGCKPIYEKITDCCAIRYDCTHLTKSKAPNKCYINGHQYQIGEELRNADRPNPCDKCICSKISEEVAEFRCSVIDCFSQEFIEEGCYFKPDPNSCCGGTKICPRNPEDRFKCVVDGVTYYDGYEFTPKENPDLYCICSEGYQGKNVEPFCKPTKCSSQLRKSYLINQNCTPVFYPDQSPRYDCNVYQTRCQNRNDIVVPKAKKKSPWDFKKVPDEMKCKFGKMMINVGDELSRATDYGSACTKCICEVPPMLTCQQLPYDQCKFKPHNPFIF